jgi:hypothetical protein
MKTSASQRMRNLVERITNFLNREERTIDAAGLGIGSSATGAVNKKQIDLK